MDLPIVLIVILAVIVTSVRIVNEYNRLVVLRLGKYVGVRGPGLVLLIPFWIERGIKADLRTTTWQLPQQEAITKDNVSVKITAVLWNRITDARRAMIDVQNCETAVRQLAATTMRSIVGLHDLDEVLSGDQKVVDAITAAIDEVAAGWGIDVQKLEIVNVEIPEGMQRAIAQKAEAMREQAARIIKAEAELKAAEKLTEAARLISTQPAALELRRMQMLTEIGAEQNTMTVVMMPSEFVGAAAALAGMGKKPEG